MWRERHGWYLRTCKKCLCVPTIYESTRLITICTNHFGYKISEICRICIHEPENKYMYYYYLVGMNHLLPLVPTILATPHCYRNVPFYLVGMNHLYWPFGLPHYHRNVPSATSKKFSKFYGIERTHQNLWGTKGIYPN